MAEESQVRTVIDIGTNSVKVLVARIDNQQQIEPLFERSTQTRLGRGLYETKRLRPDAIARTAEVIEGFLSTASTLNSPSFKIIATSAARDAENHEEFRKAIADVSGQEPEIISGEREAALVYRGVRSQPGLADTIFVADVGGGSTEFIIGQDEQPNFSISVPLGSVRTMSTASFDDPPGTAGLEQCCDLVRQFLRSEPIVSSGLHQEAADLSDIVGVGGTTTFLARMYHETDEFDRAQLEATVFARPLLRELNEKLWNLPLAQRKELRGIPAERADVIPFGAAIYLAIMEELDLERLLVSTRGIRTGLLLE
ncbi:MAG: Ppx/GppA phosphatase family protein [Verrucomicrobiia bacterium]|jgi:exopolyphosphatase/guanosine-5'-triphosphate,3'-diphosphate pyrophosphatase